MISETVSENPGLDGHIFFEYIIQAITKIRENSKRPDNVSIAEYINKSYATNVDGNYIDVILTMMIDNYIIYYRPIIKGPSYFISKQ